MKKVIAAAAGLLLAGTMVSSAVADVTISGDARARFEYNDGYMEGANRNDDSETHWDSRVRFFVNADMESGVYARVLLELDAQTWDYGEANSHSSIDFDDDEFDSDGGIDVEYAYFGVPLGNGVVVEAGNFDFTMTNMVMYDEDLDALIVKWSDDQYSLTGAFSKIADSYAPSFPYSGDAGEEDINAYMAVFTGQFDAFALTLGGTYLDNDATESQSGMELTARITADLGAIAISADIAAQEEEFKNVKSAIDSAYGATDGDDGAMGYVTAGFGLGEATTVTGVVGFTEDAVMDAGVGFIMIGGDTQLTPEALLNIGALGNTTFVGLVLDHQLNEKTALKGIVGYADMEPFDEDDNDDLSATELSGQVAYSINDDATFTVRAGYVNLDGVEAILGDDNDESVLGVGAELAIKF